MRLIGLDFGFEIEVVRLCPVPVLKCMAIPLLMITPLTIKMIVILQKYLI